jgi:hypothetical protein
MHLKHVIIYVSFSCTRRNLLCYCLRRIKVFFTIFYVYTSVTVKITTVWDLTPCNLTDMYLRSEGKCKIHQEGRNVFITKPYTVAEIKKV